MFYFCISIRKISDSFSFNHNIIYFADSVALLSSIYYMPKRRSSTVSTPEPIVSSESSSEDEIVTPDPKRSKRNERHKMTVKSLSGHFNLARCPPNCPHEHADVLTDPLNQKVHFVCTTEGCTFQSHCRCKNVYHKHVRKCREGVERARLATAQVSFIQRAAVQRFAGKVLPCLQTLTNLPSSKFVWLIRKYEDLRPDLPPNVIKEAIPETNLKKWHQHCEILAHEVWEKLCAAIDLHMVYGIAVDAGIDRAKSEHILLSVLYVGPEEYVLPPIYSPSHRAFDGKTVAEQLVFTLQANLGEHRLLKLKFMIADGSSVNHVARNNCEGALKRIYDQISPIGESDTAVLQQGISSRVPSIILLSCIGHMLNNICQTTLKPYEESPCFLFKKAFSQSFYSGGRASAAKGKYKGVALDLALARFDQGVLKAEECSQRFTKLPYTTFGRHPWSTSATPGFPCLDICIAHARPPLLPMLYRTRYSCEEIATS